MHLPHTHCMNLHSINHLQMCSAPSYTEHHHIQAKHIISTSGHHQQAAHYTNLPAQSTASASGCAWCSAWNGPYAPLKTRGGPQRPMHGQPMPATRTCCIPAALQQICARASHLLRSHRLAACGLVRAWGIPGFCQSSLDASARWDG